MKDIIISQNKMRPKISNSELAKQYFLNCSCNLKYLVNNHPKLADEKIIAIIKANELKWRNEYQHQLTNEILTTNKFNVLVSSYNSFLMSLSAYENIHELFLNLADVILKKQFQYNDLFRLFYQLVLFDFKQNKELALYVSVEKNIFEYFKKKDFKIYQKLIVIVKKIMSIDNFKETENKQFITKILLIANIWKQKGCKV